MHKFLVRIVLIMGCSALLLYDVYKHRTHQQAPVIIDKVVDERGLTSVKYLSGPDTLAYDYLTPAEFSKFIKTGNPY